MRRINGPEDMVRIFSSLFSILIIPVFGAGPDRLLLPPLLRIYCWILLQDGSIFRMADVENVSETLSAD